MKDPMEGLSLFGWQTEVLGILRGAVDPRIIHWYWEPTGSCGKTTFATHIIMHFDAIYLQGGKKSDIAHAYNGQRVVIFDLPRSMQDFISYDGLESVKNGILFSPKYDSTMKLFDRPHVIVFANFPPDEDKLSHDRWRVTTLSPPDDGRHGTSLLGMSAAADPSSTPQRGVNAGKK